VIRDDTREHYEAQLIRVEGALQLEVGFHTEHPKVALNDAVLQRMRTTEKRWRKTLGDAAVAGDFIGELNGRDWPRCEHPLALSWYTSGTLSSRRGAWYTAVRGRSPSSELRVKCSGSNLAA